MANCSIGLLSSPNPLRIAACSSLDAVGPASSATGSAPPMRTSMKVTKTTATTSGNDTTRRRNRNLNNWKNIPERSAAYLQLSSLQRSW